MKTTKRLLAIAIAALTLGACQKENGNLLYLDAEGMHNGSKLAIDGNSSYWEDGEFVHIDDDNYNGGSFMISVDPITGDASVDVSESTDLRTPLTGVYPSTCYGGHSGNEYGVNIPPNYLYSIGSGGKQSLRAPMIAYTENGNRMRFKHITGAVTVEIINDFGIDVRVIDLTVSSNLYELWGTRTIDITNITRDATDADTVQTASEDHRQVQILFDEDQLIIPSGDTARVQVPVLPVGALNKFTVTVTVQNKDDVDMNYTFTRQQASSHYLLRAQIGYAPAKFGGRFHYGTGSQYVRFAPGNLQYQASTQTWRFAKHQWDIVDHDPSTSGNSTSANRDTQEGWIDLFGYGTSGDDRGQNAFQPWNASTVDGDYISHNLSNEYVYSDWGWNNLISNGGNWPEMWRTPDWNLIISNNPAAYNPVAYAQVNGVYGIIILPVDYSHPLPQALNLYTYGTSGTNDNYGANVISFEDWPKMEVAGAIFLPAAGMRIGTNLNVFLESTGCYWSSTGDGYGQANGLLFGPGNISSSAWEPVSYGCAVRLIRVQD
jgi:hypothetical protein